MLPDVGIFGTSNVVKLLIAVLRSKGFRPVAICGIQLSSAKQLAEETEIPFYTSNADDVLLRKDVDIIFIMYPPSLQAQIAVKALGIGKHVICDRPCGLHQTDSLKMVHAAQYYPSLIGVVSFSMRFDPIIQRLRTLVRSDHIGKISLVTVNISVKSLVGSEYSWICDENSGGGVLSIVCSHFLDAITFITGQRLRQVHGSLRTLVKSTDKIKGIRQITADDFCAFGGELSGGGFLSMTANSNLDQPLKYELVIAGSKGYLSTDGKTLSNFSNETKEKSTLLVKDDFPTSMDHLVGRTEDVHLLCPSVDGLSGLIGALKEAFQGVQDHTGWNKEPVEQAATFDDGQYVQAVMEATRKSTKLREWVMVTSISEAPDPNPLISAAVRGVQKT